MLSNKILIFMFFFVMLENYFGHASWPGYYKGSQENEYTKRELNEVTDTNKQKHKYPECIPKSSKCICNCTLEKEYKCDQCIVINQSNTEACVPGVLIEFFCPLCSCDEDDNYICNDCYHKRINIDTNGKAAKGKILRKRATDSFYDDYLYNNDPLPLSTEQIRELQKQAYLQKRQEVIDKRREKQELAEQQAEIARQNAEMRKELEHQRQLDEEQKALDAQQQGYIDDYVYEDDNQQDQDDYFTKKVSESKFAYKLIKPRINID